MCRLNLLFTLSVPAKPELQLNMGPSSRRLDTKACEINSEFT